MTRGIAIATKPLKSKVVKKSEEDGRIGMGATLNKGGIQKYVIKKTDQKNPGNAFNAMKLPAAFV
jgi:hypothetical protein